MKELLRVIKYVFQYPWLILLSVLSMIAMVTAELYIPTFMDVIIDDILPAEDMQLLVEYGLYMIIAAIGMIIFGLVNNYTSTRISMYATADLREDLFVKIQSLSFKNIDHFKSSRLITTSTNDITRIQNFFTMAFRIMIRAPFMLVFGLIFALRYSPELSSVFYWAMPSLIVIILAIIIIAFPYFSKVQKSTDELNKVTLETANSPRTIKSFVTQEVENAKFTAANSNFRRINSMANKIMSVAEPAINFVFNAVFAAVIVLGISYYNNGELLNIDGIPQTGQLMAFITYAMITLSGLMMFAMVLVFLSRATVSAKRIYEVFDEEVDLSNKENPIDDVVLEGTIEFDHVSFGYGENGNYVLNDISFKIAKGETIGIIGSTGSGKSSLINLIPRLYDVNEGAVKVSGYNVKDLDMSTLRSQISVVTQQATIFSGSIGTNIHQGKDTDDMDEFNRAARLAVADEFINEYDDLYNHKVEQAGRNLSGGQKQRVSLARAFMRTPKVLILDDSTSAVDAKSEEAILKSITEISNEMTTIVISQKISTIKDMDKILVLNNKGQIDGFDTHENLLKNSKVYQEIALSQLGNGGGING